MLIRQMRGNLVSALKQPVKCVCTPHNTVQSLQYIELTNKSGLKSQNYTTSMNARKKESESDTRMIPWQYDTAYMMVIHSSALSR